MLVSGNLDLDMEKENKTGKMDQFTKDTGEIIWLMVRED
jgi:hypothetical protein